MKEGFYENPCYPVEHHKRKRGRKTLVVLCSYVPKSGKAEYNTRSYIDHDYTRYVHDRLAALKFTYSCYKKFNAGEDYKLVIVDNDSPNKEVHEWYKTLDIPIIKRRNTFFSFGAYREAWDRVKNQNVFDYFLFHEMDWVPAKDNWLKDFIDIWVADKDIGMIGNLLENRGYQKDPENDMAKVGNEFIEKITPHRKYQINLDSEYLFTDKIILNQMDKVGWLLFPCVPETGIPATYNELGFPQPILEMGYKLSSFADDKHTMFYGIYNQQICDKWRNGFEKLVPFVPEQTRLFCPEMKEYFKKKGL